MPNELDFMKSRDEREMPQDEYNKIRGEYNRQADDSGKLVKKIIFILLGALTVSAVAVNLVALTLEPLQAGFETPQPVFIWLAAFIIIIALFLYDPKLEEDKKYKYETDQKIILKSLQGKIKANKIRLGAVIAIGAVAVIASIVCWWFAFDIMRNPYFI